MPTTCGIPLAGWGITDKLTFIDEFHCDREGMGLMSKALADQIFNPFSNFGRQPGGSRVRSSSPEISPASGLRLFKQYEK